jgi:hypothetical protein
MKNNKHIESFRKFNENLNISDVRSSKKINENNNLLTNEEKIWLKNWLEYCNQQWGFEPKDHENRRSIFSKLDIN